jgi:hypothetical protein
MRLLTSGVAGILLAVLGGGQALAENAVLVAEGVLVNTDPTAVPITPNAVQNANYVSSGNNAGTILVATDNVKLYFFDVVTHLLLEDYTLGLLGGEKVKKVHFSKDGNLVIISLDNDAHLKSSKFLYMNRPPITGTPL